MREHDTSVPGGRRRPERNRSSAAGSHPVAQRVASRAVLVGRPPRPAGLLDLQRTAGNAAAVRLLESRGDIPAQATHIRPSRSEVTVQRFTKKSFPVGDKSVTGTLSENGHYFLPAGPIQGSEIYATTVPPTMKAKGGVAAMNGRNYYLCEPRELFLDDCLHAAEEIVNGKILEIDKSTYSRETLTNRVWGQSDKRNVEIANKAKAQSLESVDEAADATLGNAFVIVDTEFLSKPSERSPYHAAAVVAVDGSDRITMEVFASGGSREKRETAALLSMYTVGGGPDSFHGYWSKRYFAKYSTITIVIKAK